MEIDLKLTEIQARALVAAADVGMRSGQLLGVFKSIDEDLALIEALTKIKRALEPTKEG